MRRGISCPGHLSQTAVPPATPETTPARRPRTQGAEQYGRRAPPPHVPYELQPAKTFAFLTGFITDETDKCETAGEKIERLSWFLKEVNQVPVRPTTSYHRDRPSLKSQVSVYLAEEIEYLERLSRLAKAPAGDRENALKKSRLKLGTSVAQLACFLRLLLDPKVVQNENTAELLRFTAGACVTKRSEAVSVGSLRGKFYEVETATKESAKQLLLKMVAHIDKTW